MLKGLFNISSRKADNKAELSNEDIQRSIARFVGLPHIEASKYADVKSIFFAREKSNDLDRMDAGYSIGEAWEIFTNFTYKNASLDFNIFLDALKAIGIDEILENGLDIEDLKDCIGELDENVCFDEDVSNQYSANETFDLRINDSDLENIGNPYPDQEHPKGYYVYAHSDVNGSIFYIGKGVKKRAWSNDRHPLWHRYVQKHLKGDYKVSILVDSLSDEEAEHIESIKIARYGDSLVNWVNSSRTINLDNNKKYWELKAKNKESYNAARGLEGNNLSAAVAEYRNCLDALRVYAFIDHEESGLVGKLLKEEDVETGINGELDILDRLTLCLKKLGDIHEAKKEAIEYFRIYKRDIHLKKAEVICKRVKINKADLNGPQSEK